MEQNSQERGLDRRRSALVDRSPNHLPSTRASTGEENRHGVGPMVAADRRLAWQSAQLGCFVPNSPRAITIVVSKQTTSIEILNEGRDGLIPSR